MFTKKEKEMMINDLMETKNALELMQEEQEGGNTIHRLTLNILNPMGKYLLINTCQDLYVGIKGSGLILQAITAAIPGSPNMVKDSSITAKLASGALSITSYDLEEMVVIFVAINPEAYVVFEAEGEVELQAFEI